MSSSYGKQVAEYLQENDMQDMQMVGEIDYAASTIVGYLQKIRFITYTAIDTVPLSNGDDVRMPDVDVPGHPSR